jgi:MFS family permease
LSSVLVVSRSLPRTLYAAATGTGFVYANVAVGLPLYVLAGGHSPSLAGGLLAVETCAIAIGAVAAGPIMARVGTWRMITLGVVIMAFGEVGLLAAAANATLAPGAVLLGGGMGLFWVGTQTLLGRRSGQRGSERAFVVQYAYYVLGGILGAVATGAAASALGLAGFSHQSSIRLTFILGLAAAAACVAGCRRLRSDAPVRQGRLFASPLHGLAVQLPDLLLVAALGLIMNLAPIVLRTTFRFSPFEVGVVIGGISAAKIAGSFVAGRIARSTGARRVVFGMLAVAAPLVAVLGAVHAAGLFVLILLTASLLTVGVWPVLVDAAHARVAPDERGSMAVAWNAREYLVIAASTALGGWALSVFERPGVLLTIAAVFVGLSAAASASVLHRPVRALEPV